MKDIYKGSKIEMPQKDKKAIDDGLLKKVQDLISDFTKKMEEKREPVINYIPVSAPDIQKVEVTNPIEPQPVTFPDVQKVEVTNPTPIPPVTFPELQKVESKPLEDLLHKLLEAVNIRPKVQKVEVTNHEKVAFPDIQKVEVTNPTVNIPVGEGNIPKKADPEKYVPVRLTDGQKFYRALDQVAAGINKTVAPYVDASGKPTQVQLDSQGRLPTVAGGATVTTTSGSPLYEYIVNWPTIQSVYTVNPGSATVTTTSGTPLDTFQRNIPTVQTVELNSNRNFQITPGITTAISGSLTLTSVSGSPTYGFTTNFPTVQTVNVQNMPNIAGSVTTLSGSATDVKNFPTVQTVNVQNLPNIAGSVTTLSGSATDVKNFPTVQTVNVLNLPSIAGSVTTLSGSATDIKNFPTYQGVHFYDPSGNATGIVTNPITISGTVTVNTSISTTYSGVAAGLQTVNTGACIFTGYMVYNPNSSVSYVQVFNNTSPSLGTTNPDIIIPVPATSAANLSDIRRRMDNGIVLACTTTAKGSTPPTTGLDMTIYYRL